MMCGFHFSLNFKLWVFLTVLMSVFVPHCWISSFWTPLPVAVVVIVVGSCPLTISNYTYFQKNDFTTQRYFEPISLSLTFFPQLNAVGLLNRAHECVRPSLPDFLFSDPPLPAAVVVVVLKDPYTPQYNYVFSE